LVNVDKGIIVGDFNIHVDNTNDALGAAFTDLLKSFGFKQTVSGHTHRLNHTLDLIISYGTNPNDIDVITESDDVTDHYMVTYILRTYTPRYRPGRAILPTTIERFSNRVPQLFSE